MTGRVGVGRGSGFAPFGGGGETCDVSSGRSGWVARRDRRGREVAVGTRKRSASAKIAVWRAM